MSPSPYGPYLSRNPPGEQWYHLEPWQLERRLRLDDEGSVYLIKSQKDLHDLSRMASKRSSRKMKVIA